MAIFGDKKQNCPTCNSSTTCDCTLEDLLPVDCSSFDPEDTIVPQLNCSTGSWEAIRLNFEQLGWSAELGIVASDGASEGVGDRRIFKFIQWVGGDGDQPAVPVSPNLYLGSTGFVPIGLATDLAVALPPTSHTQNTDIGTDSLTFQINLSANGGTITASALTADRTFTLPDLTGTFALTSQLHTQNTDTGTTQATFIINSTANSSTLTTASLTTDRTHTLPDLDGTLALTSQLHTQNTDTGTTQTSFIINSTANSSTLTTSALTVDRTHTLPDLDGTFAVTSQLHTQNTDTGTTSATFVLNSTANSSTLGTSSLTGDRVHEMPDRNGTVCLQDGTPATSFQVGVGTGNVATISATSVVGSRTHTLPNATGTLALTSQLPVFLLLQFEDPTTPGDDVKKFIVPAAETWTISTLEYNGFSTPFGSYRIDTGSGFGSWTNLATSVALGGGDLVEIRPLNASGVSTYTSGVAPYSGQMAITLTRTL